MTLFLSYVESWWRSPDCMDFSMGCGPSPCLLSICSWYFYFLKVNSLTPSIFLFLDSQPLSLMYLSPATSPIQCTAHRSVLWQYTPQWFTGSDWRTPSWATVPPPSGPSTRGGGLPSLIPNASWHLTCDPPSNAVMKPFHKLHHVVRYDPYLTPILDISCCVIILPPPTGWYILRCESEPLPFYKWLSNCF